MMLARLSAAALPAVLLPGAALAQTLGQGAPDDVAWVRVILSLALVLGLAVGAAWLLKRRMGLTGALLAAPKDRRLQLIESTRLSHQVDVCLLRCDDKEFIVATSPHGPVVISGGVAATVRADL